MLARLKAAAKPRPTVVLAAHRAEIRRIASRHKALDIRVFGSVARGEDRPGSDVDLLVRVAPDASLFDQIELAQDIEDILGVHVGVVSEDGLRLGHHEIRAQARAL
jgi:predicted nucleotidyltransferase